MIILAIVKHLCSNVHATSVRVVVSSKKVDHSFFLAIKSTSQNDHTGEVSRGEKMLYSGTDPESYITEYTLVYKEKHLRSNVHATSVRVVDSPSKVLHAQIQPLDLIFHERFRGGLVFKAHRLCASLNSRLESKKEREFGSPLCGVRAVVSSKPENQTLKPTPCSPSPNTQTRTLQPKHYTPKTTPGGRARGRRDTAPGRGVSRSRCPFLVLVEVKRV